MRAVADDVINSGIIMKINKRASGRVLLSRKRLTIFLWVVWGLNLVEYGLFGYVIISLWSESRSSGFVSNAKDMWQFALFLSLLFFPCIFNYLALRLVRNYYPDKEIRGGQRWFCTILGVLQIIWETFWAALGIYFLLERLPGRSAGTGIDSRTFLAFFWSACVAAAFLNVAGVIVVWRMMRAIRRNYREAMVEAF